MSAEPSRPAAYAGYPRGRAGMQRSEFGREIPVDLEADADFDESRSCPCHDVCLRWDGPSRSPPRLRAPRDKGKSKIPDTAVSKAYADAPPAALPRRARAFPAFRQGRRGVWGQPARALDADTRARARSRGRAGRAAPGRDHADRGRRRGGLARGCHPQRDARFDRFRAARRQRAQRQAAARRDPDPRPLCAAAPAAAAGPEIPRIAARLARDANQIPPFRTREGRGQGVMMVAGIATDVEIREQRLKLLRFAEPQPSRTIGLTWRRTSPRKADFVALRQIAVEALNAPMRRPPSTATRLRPAKARGRARHG